jgi:hypothetical protein
LRLVTAANSTSALTTQTQARNSVMPPI